MQAASMHWDYIAIFVVLAILVPWRSTARVQMLLDSPQLNAGQRITLYISTMAFQWGISGVILWRALAHRMVLSQLGLAIPSATRFIVVSIGLAATLVLNQVFGVKRLASLPAEKRGLIARIAEKLLPRTRKEIVTAIGLAATVAICEEFIYRGFIQAIFEQEFHSFLAGASISALFFAIAHLYQGRRGLVTTFIIGLLFSWARGWTGSLIPSIVVHFAVDFSAGMAASRMLLGAAVERSAERDGDAV